MSSLTDPPQELADAAATIAAGTTLAATLEPGAVLALCGTMGAGKTHLTKGLCAGLGCTDSVSSPTFGLVHEYRGAPCPVFHFDFYRLRSPAEVLNLGWDDYVDSGGILIVEWPDLFPELLPEHTQWWSLTTTGTGRTLQRIAAPGH